MSDADRARWNARHGEARSHPPEPFIVDCLPALRALAPDVPRSALDVACGRGRHAVLLGREGFSVLGVDVSDVAVEALAEEAAAEGLLSIQARRFDLDVGRLPEGTFGVVLCTHFLDRALWPALRAAVAPGGLLAFQTFTLEHARRAGFPERFCLAEGELLRELAGFDVLAHRVDDDGHRHLESILARRPASEPPARDASLRR